MRIEHETSEASVVPQAAPASVDAAGVMLLQRAMGNRATSAFVAARRRRRKPAKPTLRFRVKLTGPLSEAQLKEEFIRQHYGGGTDAERASIRTRLTVPQRGTTPDEVAQGFVYVELTIDSREGLEALPQDIRRVLFADGRDAKSLAPQDYARVLAIAGKLAQLTVDERADYLARVNAVAVSLDELEASIDAYVAFRAERTKQARAYEAAAGRLDGAADVYQAYRDWRFWKAVLATRGQEAHYEAAEDRELAKQLYADLDERVRAAETGLLAALKAKGFASIRAFEAAIEAYRVGFRTQAVNVALDVLTRYEHMLYEARRKLEAGGATDIARGIAATQAAALYTRSHEAEQTASNLRSAIDPQAGADVRLQEMIAGHEQAARAAKEQADAEIRGSGEALVAERDVDRERIAGLDAGGLKVYLLKVIDERSQDVRTARTEFQEDPDRVFFLPDLVSAQMGVQRVAPDSVHARIIGDWTTDEKAKHVFSHVALGILAVALFALVPVGGWIAAAALVANIGISGHEAYSAIREYAEQERDWRLGFLSEQPSLLWVGVAIAAAAADIGIATTVLLKRTAAALKALEDPLLEFTDDDDLVKLVAKIDASDLPDELKAALKGKAQESLAAKGTPRPLTTGSATREDVRQEILDVLSVAVRERPSGWSRVHDALALADESVRGQILARIDKVMDALQNPEHYADVLADAWQLVRNGEAGDINLALRELAKRSGLQVVELRRFVRGRSFFKRVASRPASWIDKYFTGERHGVMTHLLQDLVVDRALGPRGASEFRVLLGKAGGRIERYDVVDGTLQPSRLSTHPDDGTLLRIWEKDEKSMDVGDYVWRFTYDLVLRSDAVKRLPDPTLLKPVFNFLLRFK